MSKHSSLRISVVAALFVACTTANMTSYSPVNEKTKFSEDSLQAAARDAVDELGYRPTGEDTQGHSIDTREKQVAISSVPRLSYKYSFHIDTSKGVLSINALCTRNSSTSGDTFSDCGDDRPARVIDEQNVLRKRILKIAPTIEARTPDWKGFGEAATSEPDAGAPPPKKAKSKAKNASKKAK